MIVLVSCVVSFTRMRLVWRGKHVSQRSHRGAIGLGIDRSAVEPHSICYTINGNHMSKRCVCKIVHVSFSSSSCIASYVCRDFLEFLPSLQPYSRSKIAITVQKRISKAIVNTRRASYFRSASPVAMLAANWNRLSRRTPSLC
jgi:hypothetical protein